MKNDMGKDLKALSGQMVEIFIQNTFSKNKIEPQQVNLTDAQKESLKQTFEQLKEQVDAFVHKQMTEKDVEEQTETNSPLREKFYKNRNQQPEQTEEEK